MVALEIVFVIGLVANTGSEVLNRGGRWRILSRSALEVKVNEPSYFSSNYAPAGRVKSNLTTFPSVKIFSRWVIEEDAVGFGASSYADIFDGIGVKF